MSETARFGISIEEDLLKLFDELIKKEGYKNRSIAIRNLITEKIIQSPWADDNKVVIGSITIIYKHNCSTTSDDIVHIQHEFHKSIISTTHVHLDEDYCLEVLIVKGKSSNIKQLSEKILRVKGVKHGKLTMTGKGDEL